MVVLRYTLLFLQESSSHCSSLTSDFFRALSTLSIGLLLSEEEKILNWELVLLMYCRSFPNRSAIERVPATWGTPSAAVKSRFQKK